MAAINVLNVLAPAGFVPLAIEALPFKTKRPWGSLGNRS